MFFIFSHLFSYVFVAERRAARIYCDKGVGRLMWTGTLWDGLWYFAGKPFLSRMGA